MGAGQESKRSWFHVLMAAVKINKDLIRERFTYDLQPPVSFEGRKRNAVFNWSFEDTCGNGYGRLFYSAEEGARTDVFRRAVS